MSNVALLYPIFLFNNRFCCSFNLFVYLIETLARYEQLVWY